MPEPVAVAVSVDVDVGPAAHVSLLVAGDVVGRGTHAVFADGDRGVIDGEGQRQPSGGSDVSEHDIEHGLGYSRAKR